MFPPFVLGGTSPKAHSFFWTLQRLRRDVEGATRRPIRTLDRYRLFRRMSHAQSPQNYY